MHVRSRTIRSIGLTALLAAGIAGCSGHASIPGSAHNVTGGVGKLAYTAEGNGNVYLLDADKNKKVFEGHVRRGDQVVVEPTRDRIVVAGDQADHQPALNPNHRYQIYFDRAE